MIASEAANLPVAESLKLLFFIHVSPYIAVVVQENAD
jgi:hypothetical protein